MPTVWVHAPSVGEALQAGAVVDALRMRSPAVQLAFTHFSPSAEGLGDRIGADVSAYLPWDVREDASVALDALRPSLLVFTKTEVWPVLTEEAALRRIPVAMVGATVPADAGRLGWLARVALRSTWKRLRVAAAVGEADAERLVALGVPAPVVHVTGDPAVDSAARRAAEVRPTEPYIAPFRACGRPSVVAGSTWPADEALLLDAWNHVAQALPESLLVVAPHEPSPARVRALLDRLRAAGHATVTLAEIERRGSVEGVRAVVVDRVGVLAQLYTVGDVAYVGGGFGRAGLHSVLEPAAAGVPTLFGPRHQGGPAAAGLLDAGAAREVRDVESMRRALEEWLLQPEEKVHHARRALDYIGAHRGAADRTAALLEPLIRVKNPG
jgi:3-deoxy-D-manno-octulosonic-acid transferase